jgi:hypothetical protein
VAAVALATEGLMTVAPVGRASTRMSCAAAVPDAEAATGTARDCGRPVEDLSERSATGQVFANPDGSRTAVLSAQARFARSAQGSWVDVDTSLAMTVDGTRFPVVIDPSWSGTATGGWTMVWSRSDTVDTSFWKNSTAMPDGGLERDTGSGPTGLPHERRQGAGATRCQRFCQRSCFNPSRDQATTGPDGWRPGEVVL